ncbi:hypothetical protein L6452_18310 [Arctium lappa]|uniref:Uncharacterized protein n=1 Tax=Arctium lappa TaxID=4217 RepID=A0ACB9C654_ARCLA|nr:hypothetical protein L6452_18310 [Arctium lappa]
MSKIPKMEAELDKLKNQNSKLLNQIQEFKSKVSNSDKTPDCIKCANLDKSDFADIMKEREKEIKDKDNQIEMKEKIIGVKEKIIMQKERKISNLQSHLKTTEQKSSESQDESVKLQLKFKAFEDHIYVLEKKNVELIKSIKKDKVKEKLQSQLKTTEQKSSELKDESVKLQNKLKALEDQIYVLEKKNAELKSSLQAEKEKSNVKTSSTQQSSEISKKTVQEKKDLELRCIKLSKQVSDFEKILITERDTFAKERKKNVGIFKDISEKNKNLETNFEQERSYFESEISKLTSKLSVLSSDILKEQMARSDLKKKFDTLISERNILTKKINDLEVANIELSDKVTADVISQSPVDNSTESVCSFKTTSSSIHEKNVLKKKSVKSQFVKSNQIKPSNLFYDKSVDGPASYYVKSLGKSSQKIQMVWRVKDSSEEKEKYKAFASTSKAKKNRAHKGKSFVYPDMFYSTNHLIRIAQRKICCSYCGENDFVQRESAHNWYGLGLQSQRVWLLNNTVQDPYFNVENCGF